MKWNVDDEVIRTLHGQTIGSVPPNTIGKIISVGNDRLIVDWQGMGIAAYRFETQFITNVPALKDDWAEYFKENEGVI